MAEEQQEFKVTDKRGFTEDGTSKPATEEPAEAPFAAAASEPGGKPKGEYQPIDFPTFILSYYTQGLVLPGETPNPITQKKEEDFESVRHIIDLLSMIEQKTKGNLGSEENQLLESVLYELRMKFMAKTSRIKL
jgi:hypothetical protein